MFKINFSTKREIIVKASADKVRDFLGDFNTWETWSPWQCIEPSSKLSIKGQKGTVGHIQEWDGHYIGSGNVAIEKVEPTALYFDLNFLKPWKSHSKTNFILTPIGDETKVEWGMEGNLPFFLFFMKSMMIAWLSSDYDRGLLKIKEMLETGKVLSSIEKGSVEHCAGFYYLGKRRKCAVKDLADGMRADFEALKSASETDHWPEKTYAFSLILDYKLVKGECEYIAGYAFNEKPADRNGFISGYLDAHRAQKVRHIGAYHHLTNAWAAAMSYVRGDKMRLNKKIGSYEVYRNDPHVTEEKDLITDLYCAVK